MSAEFRILHVADSHIGAGLPTRPRKHIPRRGDDIIRSFATGLARAREHAVQLVIHAGDVFDLPHPGSVALAAAAEPLLSLAAEGIPIVIVPGNHERSTIPTNLLLAHGNIHIITEPTTLVFRHNGLRVAVSAFPCIRRGSAARFDDAAEATGWRAVQADVRVLAVHQTFESATCGPGDYRFRLGDEVIGRERVPVEFDYVAAGHVHRHQVLETHDRGPSIVYAGSTDRVSFAEIDEPKGCVLVEAEGGRVSSRFIEHAVRPMSIRPVDVSGLDRTQIRERVAGILAELPERAIAQARLTGSTSTGGFRDLGFTNLARELRPDVLFSVVSRDVEFGPRRPHGAVRSHAPRCPFDALEGPAEEIVRVLVDEVGRLPGRCGVYALHDASDRLLYVGKANNVRTRVRAHLRGGTGSRYFAGWSREIARVSVRPAGSEVEALLVEAEIIRRLRPPFNRQMKRWARYCYLVECGPYGQLEVSDVASPGNACFGPFRSRSQAEWVRDALARFFGLALCPEEAGATVTLPLLAGAGQLCERYFDGRCGGPCAGRVDAREYEERRRRRDALLAGADDAALREEEERILAEAEARAMASLAGDGEKATGTGWPQTAAFPTDDGLDPAVEERQRLATLVRWTFDHCAMLRRAEGLIGRALLLPGEGGRRKAAVFEAHGIRFAEILEGVSVPAGGEEDDGTGGVCIVPGEAMRARRNGRRSQPHSGRLPKPVMDSFLIVVRYIARFERER